MLVRWPEHWLGESEHDVGRVLEALPDGLALMGVVLPSRGGREIDALLIRPGGIVTVEAKGTAMTGPVTPEPNGPWLIGGERADFAGGASPVHQARVQAQRLRGYCTDNGLRVAYISALVVIAGDVTLAPTKVIDGVWATDLDNLPAALDTLVSRRPLTRADARRLLDLLGLGLDRPTEADLDAARFPCDDGTMPPIPAAPAASQTPAATARPATPRTPTPPPGTVAMPVPKARRQPQPAPAWEPQPQWGPPQHQPAPRRQRHRPVGRQQQWQQWGPPNPYAAPGGYAPPYASRRPKVVRPWLRVFVTFGGLILATALLAAALGQITPPAPSPTPTPPGRPPATRSPAPR